ncbi:hypothetical protein LTR36_002766 [Oleoguttula mirabilis]|uniref:Uncharacterized protein n=1 Tax=Oleoguttula mirabilis TaxID=1507867 RepID=A0AAV9JK77_9PEZI|nr:hypothetical protein LTR36_002766 [Oleoguttula mirabilis]
MAMNQTTDGMPANDETRFVSRLFYEIIFVVVAFGLPDYAAHVLVATEYRDLAGPPRALAYPNLFWRLLGWVYLGDYLTAPSTGPQWLQQAMAGFVTPSLIVAEKEAFFMMLAGLLVLMTIEALATLMVMGLVKLCGQVANAEIEDAERDVGRESEMAEREPLLAGA